MKEWRGSTRKCFAAACAVCALLLVNLWDVPLLACGWSGSDAYTIVLLNAFDTDLVLQEQFYNAPSGSPFSLSRGGYRVLEAPVHHLRRPPPLQRNNTSQRKSKSKVAAARRRGFKEPVESPAYALNALISTGMAYQGAQASDAPLPLHGRFSDEWVVWTKEDAAPYASNFDDGGAGDRELTLLHCRLPLPQNVSEVRRLQQRYIARHHAAMSAALEHWWHTAPPEHTSHCLYGDGEKALTGVERYYEVCPRGTVSRVQHHRLTKVLSGTAATTPSRGGAQKQRRRTADPAPPSVLDFLHQMHDSPSGRNAILRNPRYRGVFEEIGRYHPVYSKPRWNDEHLVWESRYPSTQACATHYTTIANSKKTRAVNASFASAPLPQHKVHPGDAFWKTVVRFRCPAEPQRNEGHKLSVWTVTEVHQLCEYNVELVSELVCGWEQELDSFNVNPIPCVVVD